VLAGGGCVLLSLDDAMSMMNWALDFWIEFDLKYLGILDSDS